MLRVVKEVKEVRQKFKKDAFAVWRAVPAGGGLVAHHERATGFAESLANESALIKTVKFKTNSCLHILLVRRRL